MLQIDLRKVIALLREKGISQESDYLRDRLRAWESIARRQRARNPIPRLITLRENPGEPIEVFVKLGETEHDL